MPEEIRDPDAVTTRNINDDQAAADGHDDEADPWPGDAPTPIADEIDTDGPVTKILKDRKAKAAAKGGIHVAVDNGPLSTNSKPSGDLSPVPDPFKAS